MSPTPQTADAVDVAQASELTGLSKKALRRRLERGTLDSIKVGGRRMIPISELSRRGLLDTGEEIGRTSERDGSEPPPTVTPQDGNGSSSSAAASPTGDREPPSGPPPAEPVIDPERPGAPPAAEPQAPAAAPSPAQPAVEPAPPPAAAPAPPPAAAPAPAAEPPTPPVAPAPAAEQPAPHSPPAMAPQPAPPSPAPQVDPSAAVPPPASGAHPGGGTMTAPGTPAAVATGVDATAPSLGEPAPYPQMSPPVAPAPQAVADGGIAPPPGRYYSSPEGFYPARGASYYWYEYPAVRWLAAFVAIGLIALLAWLLLIRPDGDGGDGRAAVQAGAGPVGATQEDLLTLSEGLRQPVYWAGDLPGTRLEVTQSSSRYAYVRYLTDDAPVGDPSPDFLTVGTYPTVNAFANLRSYAEREDARTSKLDNGGLAATVPGSPTSVYFGYPHEDVQVEVYDPEPGRALNLVKTGVVRPVTVSTVTAP